MEKDKKPIYKRPWFTPLIMTIMTIALSVLDVARVGPTNFLCISYCGSGRIETTIFFHALLTIPIIALIWFVFGICMLIIHLSKNSSKNSKNNNKSSSTQNKNRQNQKNHIALPISALIFSILFIIANFHLYLPFLMPSRSEELMGIWLLLFDSSPLCLIGIILSIISCVKYKKRDKKTKTEHIFDIIVKVCLGLLLIPIVLVAFSAML